jgi:DNA mismatch repair protein MutS
LQNLNVSVREWEDRVVFLHQIVTGAADKSYGIHVAQMAGVPREVNERAEQILGQLEAKREQGEKSRESGAERGKHSAETGNTKRVDPPSASPRRSPAGRPRQQTLFDTADDSLLNRIRPLLDKIRALDLNGTTPMEALQLVGLWQQQLAAERDGEG